VLTFGDAHGYGSASTTASDPVVGIATTSDGGGYVLADATGQFWAFGDAVQAGDASLLSLARPIVGISIAGR
jgi:hypothetical protein